MLNVGYHYLRKKTGAFKKLNPCIRKSWTLAKPVLE